VKASISRSGGFGFLIYRAGGGEDVFESLNVIKRQILNCIVIVIKESYADKNAVSEKAIPRIGRIVFGIGVEENWPSVARNNDLT
jgi:hypothetical protein